MNFICTVCGIGVSKRQSVSYEGGRACRCHPEVISFQEFLKHKETERLKKEQEKVKNLHNRQEHRYDVPSLVPHCWLCKKEGITLQDFYLRQLIGMTKNEIKTEMTGEKQNFFQHLDNSLIESGMKGKLILFTFIELTPDQKIKFKGCNSDSWRLIEMTNSVVCCQHCMRKAGMIYEPPKINFDQLTKLSAVYDVFVKPEVMEIAKTEILEESLKN